MKEAFKVTNFQDKSIQLIAHCILIIEEYQAQDLSLTIRQLYYQLVSRDIIPNEERSYKNLISLMTKARLSGLVDWSAIEDRGRRPVIWRDYRDVSHAVNSMLKTYRLERRWRTQPNYIEVWIEKDALSGVFHNVCALYHVPLMANKGNSSASAMYQASKRLSERGGGKPKYIFYFGDMDPNGEDMVRDVRDRLQLFGVRDLTVTKVGLTMEQVQQYNPPPNPVKQTDTRTAAYVEQWGEECWEVDALPPNVLVDLTEQSILGVFDRDAYQRVLDLEEGDEDRLKRALRLVQGNMLDELEERLEELGKKVPNIFDGIDEDDNCIVCGVAPGEEHDPECDRDEGYDDET